MKTVDIYKGVISHLKTLPKEKKLASDGVKFSVGKAIEVLELMANWLYKDMRTGDVRRVTTCRNCQNYKRYKRKNDIKGVPFYACSIDRVRREPDFFCANGMEKIDNE